MEWLDHSKSLREQGVDPSEVLLLRRKYFFSDQNVDARDPIQLNLLYVQVPTGSLFSIFVEMQPLLLTKNNNVPHSFAGNFCWSPGPKSLF